MTVPFELHQTPRGFDRAEFFDLMGQQCSIQKSSIATEDCIWLGVGPDRMHLTQEMVCALLPMLQSFVEKGELR